MKAIGGRVARAIDVEELRRARQAFKPALHGQGRAMWGTAIIAIALAAFELLRPWPLKVVFDRILVTDQPSGVGSLSVNATLVAAAAATAAIPAIIGMLDMRLTIAVAQVGRKVTTRIRHQLFVHMHRLALPFHDSTRSGDLMVRLIGDVNLVRDLLVSSWLTFLARGTLIVGTAIVMFLVDPMLAFVALTPLPLLAFGVHRSSREIKTVTRKQRRREGDAAGLANESLRQIRVVKAYGAVERTADRFSREARSGERAGVKAARLTGRMSFVTETLTGAGTALVLLIGAQQVRNGTLTAGELLVVTSYARMLYKPLRKVSAEGGKVSKALACAGRIVDVLELPAEEPRRGPEAPHFVGRLAVRDLSVRYANGTDALRGATFDLEPGSIAVVAGPNGSGKSTLLSVLLRLVEPSHGSVLVDGQPIGAFDLASYRDRFAYVPQDLLLFGATVRENILYGRPDASHLDVEEAARLALFDEVIDDLPDGYETVLGEGGATLSGGQARRLMLARAAIRHASVLLFDEPLSGLDPSSRERVATGIRRIASGRTALVVSHGPEAELRPDVVIHLEAGDVVSVEAGVAPVAVRS